MAGIEVATCELMEWSKAKKEKDVCEEATCKECDGYGYVECEWCEGEGSQEDCECCGENPDCEECFGTGFIDCDWCEGTGQTACPLC